MCRWGRRIAFTATALALLAAPAGAAANGFFGIVPQGSLTARDFDRMRGLVGTLRVPLVWAQAEPRPGQYDFAAFDETVGEAASRGIRVLPFVYGTPGWLASDPARPPHTSVRGRAAWASFLGLLVERYGPRGSFWRERRRALPIRRWQIWNEPNFLLFWRPRPSASGYARLLGIAARAIRAADPGARVVAAGVAPVEGGMLPWTYLRRLYRVSGAKRSFDAVGLHPYASSMASLEYQIVQARRAMASGGDARTPLAVTEFGVASAGARISPMVKSREGQAAFLRRAYRLLIERRRSWRLSGAWWFTWRDSSAVDLHCVFCQHAGLFAPGGAPKPAWRAFRDIAAGAARERVR